MDRPTDGVTPGEASQSRFTPPIGASDIPTDDELDERKTNGTDNRVSNENEPVADTFGAVITPEDSTRHNTVNTAPSDDITRVERVAQFMDDLADDRQERAKLEPPHPQEIRGAIEKSRPKLFEVRDERTKRHILASNADDAKQIFDDFQTDNGLPRQGDMRTRRLHGGGEIGRDKENTAIRRGGFLARENGQITYRERTRE